MITYLLAWFPMLLIAIINGIVREAIIKKWVADTAAHQLSTITLILAFAFYIHYIIQAFTPASATMALVIGIVWMLMTLAFEFGFGRYRGMTWEALFADYNLLQGRLWILIPTWILLAPYLFYLFTAKN